jgi:adenylate cyclase
MLAPNPPKRRNLRGSAAVWTGILAVAAIYLFATRPAPLADGHAAGRTVPIERVFRIVAAENDAARALWTAEIVGAGAKSGLKFHEKWRDADVAAGPLPALFLREAATAVQKSKVPLGLFLGSDFPISQSNKFTGMQAEHFQRVRATGQPEFFNAVDIGRQTAMFPDYAVVPGCVSCHNEHPQSPKTDWKLNDMMGATTWSYPKAQVTLEEAVQIVSALRAGFGTAYDAYLAKTRTFEKPPEIGERWPREGYYLPTREAFLREFERRASPNTADRLLHAFDAKTPTN